MTSRQLSFAIVLMLILAVNVMLMHELVTAQDCECICEPAAGLVLPQPTIDPVEWYWEVVR